MTIQRQYSLPNCTLALEGFGDATASGSDLRPIMSILTNAECRFMGQPVMRGGKDFFEGLIATASLYAQEVMSGIRVPAADEANHAVQIDRVSADQHQLTFTPETGSPQTLKLNTVQLFDLVEAIDQFIADNQTLPQWSLGLKPAAKKFAQREPISKQALPFAAGLGSLAIAAVALMAMPTPQIKQPNDLTYSATATTEKKVDDPLVNPSPTPSPTSPPAPTPAASPSPTPSASATPSTTTKITDPDQLKQLSSNLETQLRTNFDANTPVAETVSYEVMLGQDGKILDYRPMTAAAKDLVNQTPLPKLRYNPVPGSAAQEPVASFQAEFTPTGVVRVQSVGTASATIGTPASPAPAATPEPTKAAEPKTDPPAASGGEIRQRSQLVELQPKLYDQIDRAWKAPNGVAFKEKLTYSVRVDGEGKVIDYAPYDQTSGNFKAETPIANIGGKEGTLDQNPNGTFARFKVVFNPNGQLEVNPWDGYPAAQP
jgi:Domain of unknown function (DUF4335)